MHSEPPAAIPMHPNASQCMPMHTNCPARIRQQPHPGTCIPHVRQPADPLEGICEFADAGVAVSSQDSAAVDG